MMWVGVHYRPYWRKPSVPNFLAWRYTHGRVLAIGPVLFDMRRSKRSVSCPAQAATDKKETT